MPRSSLSMVLVLAACAAPSPPAAPAAPEPALRAPEPATPGEPGHALSADAGELLITAHVPSAMLKRVIGIISGEEDVADEEEEDDEDGAPAGRVAPPPGRLGRGEAGGTITVERRTVVESMPATVPKDD